MATPNKKNPDSRSKNNRLVEKTSTPLKTEVLAQVLRQQAEQTAQINEINLPADLKKMSPEEISKMLHELRVHQIELEMQNDELQRTHVELEAAWARYFDIFDLAPVGYCNISEEGLILEANLTAAGMLGVARGVLNKQSFTRFVHKDDQDSYYMHRKQLFEDGLLQICELRIVRKDGSFFWAHLASSLAQGTDGALVCRVTLSDITERKQAEEHQKLQAQIIDQINDGIVATDLNGNLIFWNKGAEKLLGYSADEILGQSITMVFPSHQVSFFSRGIPLDIIEKGWHETESKFLSKTGKEIPVHVVLAAFKDTKGAVIGMIGSVNDITERKQAESKILESEERYRSLFMNMLNGFAYCRMLFDQNDAQDFIYLEVNDAFEKLTDFKNVVGKKATEVIPGIREADPELFKLYGDVALTGKPKTFEIYIKSLREWHSVTLYSPRKGYFISIFEVITERKQAEIALQVSQRGLEEAQNLAGIGSWEYDIAADKTIWSKKMFDLFGRDPALGEPSWQEHRPYIHPDDWETLDSAVKSGKGYNIEFRLLHPACGVRWSHTIALTESDENGKVVKLKGTVQDITESKLAEEKISNQLDELLRWQNVMLDREDRVQELKQEVNLLLSNGSQPPRYPSD